MADTKIDDTVVTSTRTPVSLKDAPGAVTIITAEELQDIPANDVLDIIRETAGVSLIGRGVGGRSVMSIRGLNAWHSLILIDGKRVAASDPVFGHSDFEYNWIPLEEIERIEVVRGPLSALYGSEAMGGTINIITKKPTDTWSGSVQIGGGFRDDGNGGEHQGYAARVGGPLLKEKLGFQVSAEYLRDEDTPDEDYPIYSEIEGKEVLSIASKLVYTPSDHHTLEFAVNLTADDRWWDSASRGRDYAGTYDLDKTNYSLSWQGRIGSTQSTVTLYRSDIDKVSHNDFRDGGRNDNPEQLINDVLDAQTSFSLGFNLITVGGELRKETLESATMLEGEDDIGHGALFIQDELALFGDRLLLTPGLRWDEHETFGSEVSPRINLLYKLIDGLNLKAGYGHAFRAPTIKQVSKGYYASFGPHDFIGNPDLKPEVADSYEAGVEYFRDTLFVRTLFFHNKIEDLIEWEMLGRTGPVRHFRGTNVSEAETSGIETEVRWSLLKDLILSGNYTYLDAENTETNERLAEKPHHTVNAKLMYMLQPLGLSATLRAQHIADQVIYNDSGALEKAPDYTLWHFSLGKSFGQSLRLQLGVENIGDLRLADESELFGYAERGRFYYANLRYNF